MVDPIAVNDVETTEEDTPIIIDTLLNDTDADGDPLTVSIISAASYGTLVVNPDETITYTPNVNYNGNDSFTYQIDDGNGGTSTATVDVVVNPVNDNTRIAHGVPNPPATMRHERPRKYNFYD